MLVSLLIIGFPFTNAIIPSHVRICDPSIDCTQNVKIALISQLNTNYLTFAYGSAGGFFNNALISGKTTFSFINFTALTLGAPTNPNQNFSVSLQHTNASISSVTANNLGFVTSFASGQPKLFYYWNNNVVYASPTSVNVTYIATTRYIPSSQYEPSVAAFNACVAPCVFSNPANNTLIVKGQPSSPLTINICVIGICPAIITSNLIITPGYSIDSDVAIPMIILFFSIVALILLLAFSRRSE